MPRVCQPCFFGNGRLCPAEYTLAFIVRNCCLQGVHLYSMSRNGHFYTIYFPTLVVEQPGVLVAGGVTWAPLSEGALPWTESISKQYSRGTPAEVVISDSPIDLCVLILPVILLGEYYKH